MPGIDGYDPLSDDCQDEIRLAEEQEYADASPAGRQSAQAGTCSHGGHGYDGETCSDALAVHMFTFETWPPDATERTLPGRTPRYWAESPAKARAAAGAELKASAPGWSVGAGSHHRYDCTPPCAVFEPRVNLDNALYG